MKFTEKETWQAGLEAGGTEVPETTVPALVFTRSELTARLEGGGDPVAKVVRNMSGQTSIFDPNGNMFDVSKYVGCNFYTSPPTTSAAVAAALMKAAEILEVRAKDWDKFSEGGHEYAKSYSGELRFNAKAILALPHDTTALREVCLRVAKRAQEVTGWMCQSEPSIEAIVDEALGVENDTEQRANNRTS